MTGTVFFAATDEDTGRELWKINPDGSVELAADIVPGQASSNPEFLTVVNGELYFLVRPYSGEKPTVALATAEAAVEAAVPTGDEIWKVAADGTVSSVTGAMPEMQGQRINALASFDGSLLWTSYDSSTFINSVWMLPEAGPLRQLLPEGATRFAADFYYTIEFAGKLYFRGGTDTGPSQIYSIDASGVVQAVTDFESGPHIRHAAISGENLYISGGAELFVISSDGTVETLVVEDQGPVQDVETLGVAGGKLFFNAWGEETGEELYTLDDNGAPVLAADLREGGKSSSPGPFIAFNGDLYFSAEGNDDRREIWKIDGENPTAGPVQVSHTTEGSGLGDGFGGEGGGEGSMSAVLNGALYFFSYDSANRGLWRLDANDTLTEIGDFYYADEQFAVIGDALYFSGVQLDGLGAEPWRIDSSGHLTRVADINSASSVNPSGRAATDESGNTYFWAWSTLGQQIFTLDAAGNPVAVADFPPSVFQNYSPNDLAVADGTFYFFSYDYSTGRYGVFKADASGSGVTPLSEGDYADNVIAVGDRVYWRERDYSTSSNTLHTLDGDGQPIEVPGSDGFTSMGQFFTAAGEVYFGGESETEGWGTFKIEADGNVTKVSDFRADKGVVIDGLVHLATFHGLVRIEADGTTTLLSNKSIRQIYDVGGELVFTIYYGEDAGQFWTINEEGEAEPITNFDPPNYNLDWGVVFDGKLYFQDAQDGGLLLRMDASGQIEQVADFVPGSTSGYFYGNNMIVVGSKLLITAGTDSGQRLFTLDTNGTLVLIEGEPNQDSRPRFFVGLDSAPAEPTEGDDDLVGTAGVDEISLLGGDDIYKGLGSADIVYGDAGNDRIEGGAGVDVLDGGEGIDTAVYSGEAEVVFDAASGKWIVTSAADGTETLTGFEIVDDAAAGRKLLVGGGGFASAAAAAAYFQTGDTFVFAPSPPTTTGNDTIWSSAANETIDGGRGIDTADFSIATSPLVVTLTTSGGSASSAETGTDRLVRIENVIGGSGNDTLTGNRYANVLDGGRGADRLSGNSGNDTLIIDADDTLVSGGSGTDTEIVASYSGGVTLNLATASIERAYGGNGNDTFIGGRSSEILDGGRGADSLSGNSGNDTLIIDADDTLVSGGSGTDTVIVADYSSGVTLNMRTASIERATGGQGNDVFDATGSTASVTIDGGAGNDTLTGGARGDTIRGGAGADFINGGAGSDKLYGNAPGAAPDGAADTFLFASGWGRDTIYDFEIGFDLLDFSAVAAELSDLSIRQVGSRVEITLADSKANKVTILNATVDQLDESILI
jgi:ELWxxDGT repeat protein